MELAVMILFLACVCTAEPGSAMLEHFNHLRRQWASKAQKLLVSMKKVTTVDMEEVLGIILTKPSNAVS